MAFQTISESWKICANTCLFPSAGDDQLKESCDKMTRLCDPILPQIFQQFHYDNTPFDFFKYISRCEWPVSQTSHERFTKKFDFKISLESSKGDECLGLAHRFLVMFGNQLSKIENLKQLYDVDESKTIEVSDESNAKQCKFKVKFLAKDGRHIKISSYICGFLSNNPLPFSYGIRGRQAKIQVVRKISILAGPHFFL